MAISEIDRLVQLLAKLPGLGPRSARRATLHLIKRPDALLEPLAAALAEAARNVGRCSICGNIDVADPCAICINPARARTMICVVEDVADLWALERTGSYAGTYHVLGGTLSALDGRGPDELTVDRLIARAREDLVREVILATSATVEGQTTAHYLMDRLADADATITMLAHGVPVGGELDYLDDGTLSAALKARRPL